MGLIKSIMTATSTTLADQWKEYFYCNTLDKDILVVKGQKKISSRSSNTKGSDNIISNGSGIVVNEGQCMLIVDQGKVVEVCAEPGEFTYDSSSEPSIFYGSLGKGIIDTFKTIGKRFTYGGDTAKDQRVYYINIKEIMDNKFGTANPIPFRVVDRNINLDIDVSVRCNGVYSYKIVDPLLFYTNVCGNIEREYTRSEIDHQLKTEFISALQPCFARISQLEVRPNMIPGHVEELTQFMNENLTKKWSEIRGIAIVSIAMNPVTLPEEDAAIIKQAQHTAIMKDPSMAAATLVGAQAEAMKTAAGNEAGAMMGFMGLNMANQAGGANTQSLFNMASQQQSSQNTVDPHAWRCSCGTVNTGKFCIECGKPNPKAPWICACGTQNTGKFCSNCGKEKPVKKVVYKCNKCGWKPEDPENPPKFCPECGDPFNDDDKQ